MIFNQAIIKQGESHDPVTPSEPLDPVEVYRSTRPADWLPMPTPADDEIYLLFHIPDGFSSLLAFTVTCTGEYTVELGTVIDGEFVQSSSASIASGSKYETELFADDYGDLTGDGMKQAMIKVSGSSILTWEPSTHQKKTPQSGFSGWNIVEISCKLPFCTNVQVGPMIKLRYFAWYGENLCEDMSSMFDGCFSLTAVLALNTQNVENMNYMFSSCYSLTTVPDLNTQNVKSMEGMFLECYSLISVPALNTQNVIGMESMFDTCYSLTTVPALNTQNVENMNYMFNYCYSLTTVPDLNTQNVKSMEGMFIGCNSLMTVPDLNTQNVTEMGSMFSNCISLTTVTALNTQSVTTMGSMFGNCPSLTAVCLTPSVTGWGGCDISLYSCSMTHDSIIAFFNSLPTITSAKAITLTENPGVAELTDAEKAIATQKGWTLTI